MEIKIVLVLLIIISTLSFGQESIERNSFDNALCKDSTVQYLDKEKKIFYKLKPISNSQYKIIWGKGDKIKTSTNTFPVTGSGCYEPKIEAFNYLVAFQSCGTSCSTFLILPFNDSEERIITNCIARNLNMNLVAYWDDEVSAIIIENIKTGRKYSIIISNLCNAGYQYDCLLKSYFRKNIFYLSYDVDNNKSNHKQHRIKIWCDLE
jgi:hypothetical protein